MPFSQIIITFFALLLVCLQRSRSASDKVGFTTEKFSFLKKQRFLKKGLVRVKGFLVIAHQNNFCDDNKNWCLSSKQETPVEECDKGTIDREMESNRSTIRSPTRAYHPPRPPSICVNESVYLTWQITLASELQPKKYQNITPAL